LANWIDENQLVVQCIADQADANVVVDASKHPARLGGLLRCPDLDLSVFYLMRDARAIVHSYARKYHKFSVGALKLHRVDQKAIKLTNTLPRKRWMTLTYEDLSSHFQSALREMCYRLELPFNHRVLSPDPSSFRGIGGNRMRYKKIHKIECDMAWVQEMNPVYRIAASVLFYRYNRRISESRRRFAATDR